MKLHEKLYQLRKKQGLTQEELAEKLEVSRQSISNWETGKVVPTTKRLTELSQLYNVPFHYFLTEEDEYLPIETTLHEVLRRRYQKKWILTTMIIIVVTSIILGIVIMIYSNTNNASVDEEVILDLYDLRNESIDQSSESTFGLD